MKAVSVKDIKKELTNLSNKKLIDICLQLSKFKKENKELLTYVLFESENEEGYIENIKFDIDEQFALLNRKSAYLTKKGVRKILRDVKKFIRYSKNKETEIELILHFCKKMRQLPSNILRLTTMSNLYDREIKLISKNLLTLHEDLQHDYMEEINQL